MSTEHGKRERASFVGADALEDLIANRNELLKKPNARDIFDSSQFPAEIRNTETIFIEHKNKIFVGK